jgi:hypothetical protein
MKSKKKQLKKKHSSALKQMLELLLLGLFIL